VLQIPQVAILKQLGTRPGGLCDIRTSWIITGYRFTKLNIFASEMYSMDHWSFWSWFVVFDEDMREKHFPSQWPWPL